MGWTVFPKQVCAACSIAQSWQSTHSSSVSCRRLISEYFSSTAEQNFEIQYTEFSTWPLYQTIDKVWLICFKISIPQIYDLEKDQIRITPNAYVYSLPLSFYYNLWLTLPSKSDVNWKSHKTGFHLLIEIIFIKASHGEQISKTHIFLWCFHIVSSLFLFQ